jgi:CMP-N-acetylneuraminic acid synthetase
MNILAFIPARGNSKSIPGKNIKLLAGKPLIAYSIESAFKCNLPVIVSTDSLAIKMVSEKYGAKVMIRPDKLAKDDTAMIDVLKSEVLKINPSPEFVLLLQPTSPLRLTVHIKSAISYLENNLDRFDSVISVEKVPEKYNPYAMIMENKDNKIVIFRKLIRLKEKLESLFTGKKFVGPLLSGFPISQRMIRRQDLPQTWIPDGSIYLFKTENLLKGSMYGERVLLLETGGTINLNTLEDWNKLEEKIKIKLQEKKCK